MRFHSLAISWSLLGVVGSLSGVVGTCQELSGFVGSLLGLVGSCRELSGVCWDLSGVVGSLSGLVGSCRELSGVVGNVDFMESHFEGIAIVVNKISAEFPIPEILRSVPELQFLARVLRVQRFVGVARAKMLTSVACYLMSSKMSSTNESNSRGCMLAG